MKYQSEYNFLKKSLKYIVILAVIFFLSSCRPNYSEETDLRAIELGHRLVSIDATTLPDPKPYSESGVKDLVYFSPGLSNKMSSLKEKFHSGYEIELYRKDDGFLDFSYDRQLGKFVYSGVTHLLIYSAQGRGFLGLRLRFDKDRDKFHIVGYWSPTSKI